MNSKIYVPDTSAVLDNPKAAMYKLGEGGNILGFVDPVIRELRILEHARDSETQFQAREAKRMWYELKDFFNYGSDALIKALNGEPVKRLNNGGAIIYFNGEIPVEGFNEDTRETSGDNRIIRSFMALHALKNNSGFSQIPIILTTEDVIMYMAGVARLQQMGHPDIDIQHLRYGNINHITLQTDIPMGYQLIVTTLKPDELTDRIKTCYEGDHCFAEDLQDFIDPRFPIDLTNLKPNEGIIVAPAEPFAMTRWRNLDGILRRTEFALDDKVAVIPANPTFISDINQRKMSLKEIEKSLTRFSFVDQQNTAFVNDESPYFIGTFNSEEGRIKVCEHSTYWDRKRHIIKSRPILGITPDMFDQIFYTDHLMNPEIPLVFCNGGAGVGKTSLAVMAALFQTIGQPTQHNIGKGVILDYGYDNGIAYMRPEYTSSQFETGFLPGDFETKMAPWAEPFYLAIRKLSLLNEHDFVSELQGSNRLTLLSTGMLRGLDIDRMFVIIDEEQNAPRTLVKTQMTRFATCKSVVLGDVGQIDNPKLSMHNCGYILALFKALSAESSKVGAIRLSTNRRGFVSSLFSDL